MEIPGITNGIIDIIECLEFIYQKALHTLREKDDLFAFV